MVDTMPPALRDFILNSTVAMSTPPAVEDETMAWYVAKVTSHPLATWRQPLRPAKRGAEAVPRTFVACTNHEGGAARAEPLRASPTGKSYVYAERGETMLKGFEDAVRLYEVPWQA